MKNMNVGSMKNMNVGMAVPKPEQLGVRMAGYWHDMLYKYLYPYTLFASI